ncbi:MAG: response regulator transcription factor [Pseudonocardiaceae bacterium]
MGCESVAYVRVEHTTGRLLGNSVEPSEMDITSLPGVYATFNQHPGFSAYRSGRLALGTSAALTDLTDLPALRSLPLYVNFYRPRGIKDQLSCAVQSGNQQGTALAFNRARYGFSHRDRAVADLVTPHLAQAVAHRQHLASLTAAVHSLGRYSHQVKEALPRLSTLTTRERDVVEHLIGGITDREIARSLAISPRTVHKHLEAIYRKLGLGNRTSLIALVHQANDAKPAHSPHPAGPPLVTKQGLTGRNSHDSRVSPDVARSGRASTGKQRGQLPGPPAGPQIDARRPPCRP